MLTTLAILDDARGWKDLPGYRRFDYTFRSGDKVGLEALWRSTGLRVCDYTRPAHTQVTALRFDVMFLARVLSRPFDAEWSRTRASARRRFLYLFALKGVVELTLDGDETSLKAGEVGILRPGTGAVQIAAQVDVDFIAFSFDQGEVPEFVPEARRSTVRVADSPVLQSSLAFLRGAVQAPALASPQEMLVFRALTRDVARALARGQQATGAGGDIVDVAREVIAAGASSRQFSAATVAKELAISRRSVERAFAERGLSVSDEIRAWRAREARRLIRKHPSSPLPEVVEASGFGSLEGMRRALRRYYDTTPARLRSAACADTEGDIGVEVRKQE